MLIMPKFVEKNRLNMPSTRIRQEQEIVAQMVRIYCRQKEKHTDLCPDCKELLQYAHARLSHCPFGEKKTTCRLCPVHCYKPDRRKKMQDRKWIAVWIGFISSDNIKSSVQIERSSLFVLFVDVYFEYMFVVNGKFD